MPVETTWYVEKRLFCQRFYGDVTLDDYGIGIQQASEFIREALPPVHAIADLTGVTKFPPLFQLNRLARRTANEGVGWTVVVVTNPLLRFVASMLIQFSASQYSIAPTLERAIQFLAARDHSLILNEVSNGANPPPQ